MRQEELKRAREQKQARLEAAVRKAHAYLNQRPRAKVATQERKLAARVGA